MMVPIKPQGPGLWEWAGLGEGCTGEPMELDSGVAAVTLHAFGVWGAARVLIEGTLETADPTHFVALYDPTLVGPMRLTASFPLVHAPGGLALLRPRVVGGDASTTLTVRCRLRRTP